MYKENTLFDPNRLTHCTVVHRSIVFKKMYLSTHEKSEKLKIKNFEIRDINIKAENLPVAQKIKGSSKK